MCGRYTLSYKAEELQLSLGITDVPQGWEARYNIAPTQPIPAIIDEKARKLELLYWGLVPSWAKDISIGSKMINARLWRSPHSKIHFREEGAWSWQMVFTNGRNQRRVNLQLLIIFK
jgi:putative SOS response-associated peptidase YedK